MSDINNPCGRRSGSRPPVDHRDPRRPSDARYADSRCAAPPGRNPSRSARPTPHRNAPPPNCRPASNPRSGRRPAPRRFRPNRRFPIMITALICIILLIVIIASRGGDTGSLLQGETFAPNVFINNQNLTGCTREEGYALMEAIRDQRINVTHTITYGDRQWTFKPADVDAWIDFESALDQAWNFGHVGDKSTRRKILDSLEKNPVYLTCELTYDESALDAFVARIAEEVDVAAVDAEVTLTAEKPVFNRLSENGQAVNRAAFKTNLIALIEDGVGDTLLPVETVVPAVSSDDYNVQPIASFSTDVSFRNASSRSNVRLSLNYFNAMAVYPGDTVSFNTVVGPRTEAAGFKKAPEYAGNETVEGVGGGVCQASTTLYNAVIRAGMTIIDRKAHSMTVSYVKPSQDAAVEYGDYGKDFIFRNDTEHAIYIYTEVTKETATVTIFGTPTEYRIELESLIVSEEPTTRKRYVDDTSGQHVYYTTDEPKLKEEGKGAVQSQGWLVYYDWTTGEEVAREQESFDNYYAGVSVYWRGVHTLSGQVTDY